MQLKRRRDLVPNLVQAVEAYARHERETMSALTEARSAAAASTSRVFREQAESRLSGALAAVHLAAEAYPDLRASRGFSRLQAQLAEVEDDIVGARRIFNSNVQRYNDLVQSVPAAGWPAWPASAARQYFDVETSAERNVPQRRRGRRRAPRRHRGSLTAAAEGAPPPRRNAASTRAFHLRRILRGRAGRIRVRARRRGRGRAGRLAALRRS